MGVELSKVMQQTKNLNLLLVEDDVDLCEGMKDVLGNLFHTVDGAFNGKEALDKYIAFKEKNSKTYDIVVTDINMPISNGIDMAKSILEINLQQKIIIMSADQEKDIAKDIARLEIEYVVKKPIVFDELFEILYKLSKLD